MRHEWSGVNSPVERPNYHVMSAILSQVRLIESHGETWVCDRSQTVARNLEEIETASGTEPDTHFRIRSLFDLNASGKPFAAIIEKREITVEDLPVTIY